MEGWIPPLVVLALVTTAGYFWGRKKNRWIGGWIAREAEAALGPRETEYVNIGGSIGYHFTFALAAPLREAKGTFALLPRHSILYLPLSFLIRRHDRFYLQLYADRPLLGEGHILREDFARRERERIAGAERMREERLVVGGTAYLLLWADRRLDGRLRQFAERLLEGGSGDLLHFCCYPENRNFFLYLAPVQGRLEPLLRRAAGGLERLLEAEGSHGS